MLYLVVCGKRFQGQSVLSLPQNIFPLLHREEKCPKPISLVPLHLEGFLLGKSRGDILQCYQGWHTTYVHSRSTGVFPSPTQPSWFLCTRQREKETLRQFCFHRGWETARTSLCFCKQNRVLFGPFSPLFSSQLLGSVFSAPEQQELFLFRLIILKVVQGITEVPFPTVSTGAPGAIT